MQPLSIKTCAEKCNNTTDCFGILYRGSGCYLKYAPLGTPSTLSGSDSYVQCPFVYSPPPSPPPSPPSPPPSPPPPPPPVTCGRVIPNYLYVPNTNSFGSNLRYLSPMTPSDCSQSCLIEPLCVGFLFESGNACYLKRALSSPPLSYNGDSYVLCNATTTLQFSLLSVSVSGSLPSPPPAPEVCGDVVPNYLVTRSTNVWTTGVTTLGLPLQSPTLTQCGSACTIDPLCVGFLLQNSSCYKKIAPQGTPISDSNSDSYVRCQLATPPIPPSSPPPQPPSPPPPPPSSDCGAIIPRYAYYPQRTYDAYEYGTASGNFQNCSDQCLLDSQCVAFTVSNNTCYFKTYIASAVPAIGWSSWVVCSTGPTERCGASLSNYTLSSGYDALGGDFGTLRTPDVSSCGLNCDQKSSCSGFVFLNGVCSFKNTTLTLNYNRNAYAYTKCR